MLVGMPASAAYWAKWYAAEEPPAPAPMECQHPYFRTYTGMELPIIATRFACWGSSLVVSAATRGSREAGRNSRMVPITKVFPVQGLVLRRGYEAKKRVVLQVTSQVMVLDMSRNAGSNDDAAAWISWVLTANTSSIERCSISLEWSKVRQTIKIWCVYLLFKLHKINKLE
jgi:hypothetical protein